MIVGRVHESRAVMIEEAWLTSENALKLRGFILEHAGTRRMSARRKLRLLGCWGCRQLWDDMKDDRSRHAVEVAERLADNEAHKAEVAEALAGAELAATIDRSGAYNARHFAVAKCAEYTLSNRADLFSLGGLACYHLRGWPEFPGLPAKQTKAGSVRCIFGNPFRPVKVDPLWFAWNDGTLKRLARSIYDERTWDQMPILGDALEDAGCTEEAIFAHCRGPGPHTRGCWVVDLLLGKE